MIRAGGQRLVLFVLAVVLFVRFTGGCDPAPVCEGPNDLDACGRRPAVTETTN